MVKILNGEIVSDNDPRVRQRSFSNASNTSATVSPYLTSTPSPQISSNSPMNGAYYGNTNNHHLNVPPHHLGSTSPYQPQPSHHSSAPYYSPYHQAMAPFSLPQSSDQYTHPTPSSRSIYQSNPSSLNTHSPSFSSPTLINGNVPHASSQYSLFGLPPVFFYDLCIPPHIYLPTLLLLYLIGPPSLLAILPAFMFYRWHLLREAEKLARERTFEKFLPFKNAKTRNRMQMSTSTIHTITDWQQQSSPTMGM